MFWVAIPIKRDVAVSGGGHFLGDHKSVILLVPGPVSNLECGAPQ